MLEGTSPVCGLFVDLGRSCVDSRWVMCWRGPVCRLFVNPEESVSIGANM